MPDHNLDRQVGARIRQRRVALGLTQQNVADLVGITYQQQHKYERGINRVSASRLHQLATVLTVPPSFFFEGVGGDELPEPGENERLCLEAARLFAGLPVGVKQSLTALMRAMRGEVQ